MYQDSINHDEYASTRRLPDLLGGRASRRKLLRRLMFASAGLGLAPLLAACGGGGDEEEDDEEQEEQEQDGQNGQEQEEEEQGGEDEGEDV